MPSRPKRKAAAPQSFEFTPYRLKTLKSELHGIMAIQSEVQSSLQNMHDILQQVGMIEVPKKRKKAKSEDLNDEDSFSDVLSEHESDDDFIVDDDEEEYEEDEEDEDEEEEEAQDTE
jgi:hypothetical protein